MCLSATSPQPYETITQTHARAHVSSNKHFEDINNKPGFKCVKENEQKLKRLTPVCVKAMHGDECLSRAASGYCVELVTSLSAPLWLFGRLVSHRMGAGPERA